MPPKAKTPPSPTGAIHHSAWPVFPGTSSGPPVLREVLGAQVYLEPFEAADGPRLERLHDEVAAWIGGTLTYAWGDLKKPVAPFSPDVLGALAPDVARGKGRSLFIGDGSSREVAPCWGYRFGSGQASPSAPMLVAFQLIAPIDTDPLEFASRVSPMLEALRVRWASIGYAYSLWGPNGSRAQSEVRAAHATRHVGFDVGEDSGEDFRTFHAKVRSVNWWTVLGAALEKEWRSAGGSAPVERLGPHALIRATDLPLRGDSAAGDVLPAYRRVDEALRPVRASACASPFGWYGWDRAGTDAWLRRFESAPA